MARWMTIGQKRGLIKQATDCPSMNQLELAAWAKATYKLKRAPAQATISSILKNAATITDKAYGDDKRRKPLEVTSPILEVRLAEWIQKVKAQNICLSRELIKMKARDLQKELCDAWELSFSDGWLTRFERRHQLRFRQRQGEAASADAEVVRVGREKLQSLTDQYEAHEIYNMDETGLCYAMAPARSICTGTARGVKKKKTRITLAHTANADSADALSPLFLGRAKQPRCFEKRTAGQLGVDYQANKKAWMTAKIFQDWLRKLDRDMRAAGRHILLFLDNASSHKTGNVVSTNVRVEFLPPNTTAFQQPMDAGIIALFKRAYLKKQLRWAYDKVKNAEEISKDAYTVDQLQAMQWSQEIWRDMQSGSAIANCFQHTGIVFNAVGNSTSYSAGVDVDEIIVRASELII